MDPMKKPEWFELVEKDGGLPRRTVKRGFRAVAPTGGGDDDDEGYDDESDDD
jgi:hypothetical protein